MIKKKYNKVIFKKNGMEKIKNNFKCLLVYIFLFLISFFVTIKSIEYLDSHLPKIKSKSIPDEAKWIGGVDGGCWIDMKNIKTRKYRISIFFEEGGLWYNKEYQLLGDCDSLSIDDIVGFDGVNVLLKEELKKKCWLK